MYSFQVHILTTIILTAFCISCSFIKTDWTPYNSLEKREPNFRTLSGNEKELSNCIQSTSEYIKKLPDDYSFQYGNRTVLKNEVLETLLSIKALIEKKGLTADLLAILKNDYELYFSRAKSILVTGYYEAELYGSRVKKPPFIFPVYRKPKDPSIKAELTRANIDTGGALKNMGLEIAWVSDPFELFLLHVQGSGRIKLIDGTEVRVGFDGKNRHEYSSIGKYMIQKGYIAKENSSLKSIESYFSEHPEVQREILNSNRSYVFFKEHEGGPKGALGTEVVSFQSVATDLSIFPKGGLAILETEIPQHEEIGSKMSTKSFTTIVCNNDAGSAVKGPGRVDLFMGRDRKSAGEMHAEGTLAFLLKK